MSKQSDIAYDEKAVQETMKDPAMMEVVASKVAQGCSAAAISADMNIPRRIVSILIAGMGRPYGNPPAEDSEVSEVAVRAEAENQARRAQKFMDKNRVERKAFREGARFYNAVEELTAEVRDLLGTYKFSTPRQPRGRKPAGAMGIIQLSDLHLNEVVELCDTMGQNAYSYEIAAARLQKYACRAIEEFESNSIRSVLVLMTGDILNSDRRLDEILGNAGNRSKALVVAVDLLQQFIRHLAEHFSVEVMSVCGNEARKDDDLTSATSAFTHNYDYDIHMMLAAMFAANDTSGVMFHPVVNASEVPFKVGPKTILGVHGHQFDKGGDKLNDKISKIVAKYARVGIIIDYVVFGHMHATHISDYYARSSSLVGSNAYSNNALMVSGLAAQNIYMVRGSDITGEAIPLQHTDGYEGYSYRHDLVAGSGMRKSLDKARDRKTVFEVVV